MVVRRLARDQWVRIHGTPRVTVLAGGPHAREIWTRWLAHAQLTGELFDGELDAAIREAIARAVDSPTRPIAVLAAPEAIASWRTERAERTGGSDRLVAMVDEGLVVVEEPAVTATITATGDPSLEARSVAEATLFEALEATPATTGRFRLNERLSVRFGPTACEVDLLARTEQIAIEIDGIHHFADPACYRRDRRKDLLLQTQGLVVVRLLAEDVMRDVRDAVSVVCQALAFRLGDRP